MTSDQPKKLVEVEERVIPAVLSAVVIRLVKLGFYLGITDRTGDLTIEFDVVQSGYGYRGREFGHRLSFRVNEDEITEVVFDGSVMKGISLSHKDSTRAELRAGQIVERILEHNPEFQKDVGFVAQEKSRSKRRTTDGEDHQKS